MKKTALIATSTSGGHIFPALALADSLKTKLSIESFFITLDGKLTGEIRKRGYPVFCFGQKRSAYTLIYKIWGEVFRSFVMIKKYKPCVAIGFGGSVSIGPLVSAKLLNKPIIIHEQNAKLGGANKLLRVFSDRIALGFPVSDEDASHGNSKQSRVVFTGNPVRPELLDCVSDQEARRYFDFSPDKPIILVVGGSQGSHNINTKFVESLQLLKDFPLQIIHITGNLDYDFVRKQYEKSGIACKVFNFLDMMQFAYKIADLVISRAGAMTLAEVSLFGIPAVLIPYPYAKSHQERNADFLKDHDAAVVIRDRDLSAEKLFSVIRSFLDNSEKRERMQKNMRRFSNPKATDSLITQIAEVVNA